MSLCPSGSDDEITHQAQDAGHSQRISASGDKLPPPPLPSPPKRKATLGGNKSPPSTRPRMPALFCASFNVSATIMLTEIMFSFLFSRCQMLPELSARGNPTANVQSNHIIPILWPILGEGKKVFVSARDHEMVPPGAIQKLREEELVGLQIAMTALKWELLWKLFISSRSFSGEANANIARETRERKTKSGSGRWKSKTKRNCYYLFKGGKQLSHKSKWDFSSRRDESKKNENKARRSPWASLSHRRFFHHKKKRKSFIYNDSHA